MHWFKKMQQKKKQSKSQQYARVQKIKVDSHCKCLYVIANSSWVVHSAISESARHQQQREFYISLLNDSYTYAVRLYNFFLQYNIWCILYSIAAIDWNLNEGFWMSPIKSKLFFLNES